MLVISEGKSGDMSWSRDGLEAHVRVLVLDFVLRPDILVFRKISWSWCRQPSSKLKFSSSVASNVLIAKCNLYMYKPVGDWISAPSPNFVAMATRVGPTTFCMVPLNRPRPSPKIPC